MSRFLRSRQYDIALVPHRSIRSAAVVALCGIPARVGFNTSAGRILFTNFVLYEKDVHEIDRNLAFLKIFGIIPPGKELPSLHPSKEDAAVVDQFLSDNRVSRNDKLLAVAPGSVWNTKRWHAEGFAELSMRISGAGWKVVLVGGKEDEELCGEIRDAAKRGNVFIAAGVFTVMQSAELLRRCNALVTNDSAPLHLAVAMRTRVVAIFGATVPSFGFAPCGERDVIVETAGLACRPCTIHGGDKCPIGTFECMVKITAEMVYEKVMNA
jgi:heptosyltransferase-2